ncbi:ABC transporter ATP-binding protein [Cucumibacter marinus]|uniref:ABC transporter ATP-binding protein n=1 Tax=Cucumibacter marinus TaxID=1121252 RepID=UPI0003FCE02F|nr:ABC transporter ATP-binding protein [Cucumibacter marinus]
MSTGATPLLEVRDLCVDFVEGPRVTPAVRHVDFTIAPGETLALVGESGSGKSVTALSILRLLPYPQARHPSGSIVFEGQDLMTAPERVLRGLRGNGIAMIFQEPMSSLNPLHTVERQIGEALSLHRGLSGAARRREILALLDEVGIANPEERLNSFPHQLSGGQRQRVMIAMALANRPRLLIADEPTTSLDVTVQAQILALLKDIQARRGMAILFITHDLGIVRHMADRIAVMKDGELVEQGAVAEVLAQPREDYTKRLLAARPIATAPPADRRAEPLVEARDLKVWFPVKRGVFRRVVGHIKGVDGVDLTLRKGQTLGVVGESGSGKSTLGLALLRLVSSKGEILFRDRRIDGLSRKAMRPLRADMQIVFQDPFGSLSPRMTIAEIIAEGLSVHRRGLAPETIEDRVVKSLKEVGLDPQIRFRYPHEFSGGQRQRIAIARALVLEPELLVLDEPTSALDKTVQAQIVTLLERLQREHGLSYLFISHDLAVVRALASEMIIMKDGRVVESGETEAIFADPKQEYTRTLLAAALESTGAGVDT